MCGAVRRSVSEGSGHGSYPRTECVRSHVERYLIERATPPTGASCPAAPA
ncbi:alpha/beta hydrolase [Micromonospora sp. NPDC005206]